MPKTGILRFTGVVLVALAVLVSPRAAQSQTVKIAFLGSAVPSPSGA